MKKRSMWVFAAAIAVSWAAWEAGRAAEAGGAADDPAKVVGVLRCTDCHAAEVEAWKTTRHAKTFDEMHGSDDAKAIAAKLGELTGEKIRSIKKAATCQKCHYTVAMEEGKPEAKSGISCESCHGAAAEWVDSHQDYGGEKQPELNLARKAETAEHRKARLDGCAATGMIRPDMYYQLARNCFSCHSVPEEDLVDKCGHEPGYKDFELVAWTQGEVRHNAHWTVDGEGRDLSSDHKNREASVERKRMLYVVGRLTDLEFTLRAMSQTKNDGGYYERKTMRAGMLLGVLGDLQKACPIAQVDETLKAAGAAELEFARREGLGAIADQVGKLASDFASNADAAALSGIDPLLPTEYRVHQSE